MGIMNNIKNITVNSTIADYSAITGLKAYAIHFDINGEGTATIENCTLNSYGQCALGVGLHQNQKLIVRNCELNGLYDGELDYHNGGLLIHDYEGSNAQSQYAIFDNCTFYGAKGYPLYLYSLGDESTYCEYTFRNCICISKNRGKELYKNTTPIDGNYVVGRIVKGITSYNNNVNDLNNN